MSKSSFVTGLCCAMAALVIPSYAQGEFTAEFLTLGTGAAAAGQGGVWGTSMASATSFYWNPALILNEQRFKFYVENVSLFDGLSSLQTAAFQLKLREHWALSLGAQLQVDDDIPRYGELQPNRDPRNPDDRSTGNPLGTFSGSARALTFGLSHEFWFDVILGSSLITNSLPARLAIGGAFRMIDQNLDDVDAAGSSADLGAKLVIQGPVSVSGSSSKELVFALSLQNLIRKDVEWDTGAKDALELNVKNGVSWSDTFRKIPVGYRLALEHDSAWDGVWHMGGELFLAKMLILRAGGEGNDLGNIDSSTGAGIRWKQIQVDYAFKPHDLGANHRLSLELGF